jgi:RHS repeat-associated protein
MTSSTGATIWSATTRPYGDLVETSSTGVVTNLRLPGQYDEKLLSSIGIQGPYYNWNRWYLPMAGRYLELDPIALGGGFNGAAGPEWYGYASGSPLVWTDPTGENPAAGAAGGAFVCGPACAAAGAAIGAGAVWLAACNATHTCPWHKPITCAPPLPKPKDKDPCDAQYETDGATCRGISRARGPSAAARCWSSAMDRLVACQKGFPIPPLDIYNN